MQLLTSFVYLSLVMSACVSASPIRARGKKSSMKPSQMAMNGATGASVGAAYFITNELDGNFVVAADIGQDGKLNLRTATSTLGVGAHGDDAGANGPDPLFTQGAVKASASGNILATVNAGSNTISVFSIDPANPTSLQMIGAPVGSGGEFPVSLAINKAGDAVCVLNGGEVNGVGCFSVDVANGAVSPIAGSNRVLGLNQTTPAAGPAGSASHVVFSEDGSQLVASVKGVPPTPGFLAVWDVAQDGSLSEQFQQVAPANGGLLPFSMTVVQGKNAILATDAGLGFDIFDFAAGFDAAEGNGTASVAAGKSSAVAIDGQVATCWSSFSSKTGNFYLTDIGTSLVTEINVDDNLKGTLVKQYPQGNGSATIDNDIASIGNNDFMFVLMPNATAVNVLSLNAPGDAQIIQTLDIAGPAKKAGLTISASQLQGMTAFVKK